MSLDWDLTKIENSENICWKKDDDGQEYMNPCTESLIWMTMAIGIGKITEENAADVYARISMWEDLFDTMMSKFENGKRIAVPITAQDVVDHIGLRTNVGKETEASFRKRVADNYFRECRARFKSDIKEKVN